VVGAIEPEIEKAEIERASQRPTGSIDAVAELYRGAPHVSWPTSPENNDKALQHFKNAIAIDPRYAQAYGLAALRILREGTCECGTVGRMLPLPILKRQYAP
jgi:hypothetical protein